MSIIIGADIVPTKENEYFFREGEVLSLVGNEIKKILNDADYRVFNLESPLIDEASPIEKFGPALRADVSTVNGLKKMGVDLVTLANNHIMDQGIEGLASTIKTLDGNKIDHLGAGANLSQAQKPFVVNVRGKEIGFYACAEHEFSIAGGKKSGANPFDALESFDHVADLRKKCDFVVVLYHGGKEHYRYPSPMLQRVCRKFVEKGANLIICQHSHCIGCMEKYDGGTIVYGQGNFIFSECDGPTEQTSILVKLTDNLNVEYIPLAKTERGVQLAMGDLSKAILIDFNERSENIKQLGFIENEYRLFASKMLDNYILTCSGYAHKYLLRVLNKLTAYRLNKLFMSFFKRKEFLAIQNYIECEAHRELWLEGLKNIHR